MPIQPYSGQQFRVTPSVDTTSTDFVMTRRSSTQDAQHTTIVRVKEFTLPPQQYGTDSIIVGSDHDLWFTERRRIGHMTVNGTLRGVPMGPARNDPGMLIVGPDGDTWANTAVEHPPRLDALPDHITTPYQVFRISPNLYMKTFGLPKGTIVFPTNIVKIDSTMYFGLTQLLYNSKGSEYYVNFVATIGTNGFVRKLFEVHDPAGTLGWVQIIATPDHNIWIYGYSGEVYVCSLSGKCKYIFTGPTGIYVESLNGTVMAYSPADHDVYICDIATSTIYKLSLEGKKLSKLESYDIGNGAGELAYFHGHIWVDLGGDSQGRPMLGNLSPSGQFSEVSLPFKGPTWAVTGMVEGPDGHLWYLRGPYVGEIL